MHPVPSKSYYVNKFVVNEIFKTVMCKPIKVYSK